MDTPNPGSPEAVALGCTCPIADNGHGSGCFGAEEEGLFYIADDCPLHGKAKEEEDAER